MKKPISATIDEELLNWIEKELQNKERYRNKSHLIEVAIHMLKKSEKFDKINKVSGNKKSQAALEFLATYGWAFLVILVVIAALSYFGVLSPSKLLPERCNFGSEFGCVAYTIASNGLQLRLKNNVGEPVIVSAVTISSEKSLLSCTPSIVDPLWKSGEVKDIPISCDFANAGLTQGEKGKLNLKITYYPIRSSSSFSRDVNGEVLNIVQNNLIQIQNLAAILSFNEGSGTIATDSSGSTNDATVYGNPAWVDGKKGSAILFDGVDNYVEIPDSISFDLTDSATIMAWIYLLGLTGNSDQDMILNKDAIMYEIAVHDNTGPDDGVHTCGKSTDQIPQYNLAFYFCGLSGLPNHNCGWKDGGGTIPKNAWTHVAVTYDGSAVRTYINGIMQKEYTAVSGTICTNDHPVRIGARDLSGLSPPPQTNRGALFNGIIDEVKIYKRALTPNEILIEYNS